MEEEKRKTAPKDIALITLLLVVLIALIAAALIADDGNEEALSEPRTHEFSGYFNTSSFVKFYFTDTERDSRALEIISDGLKKYHELFDIYYGYEGVVGVWELNETAKDGPVTVSRELFDFLEFLLRPKFPFP